MKITWAGQSCFQISISNSKEHFADVVIDPFDEKIGLKVPNFNADILLISHSHHDHSNKKGVKGTPFTIDNPGEYEIGGIFIYGIDSFHDDVLGRERGKNIIYVVEAEDMRLCHLGDFGQKQLTDEQLEKIGHIDILMVPVGGTYTIDSKEAQKVIGQIEPRIVIPMHYNLPKLTVTLDGVDKFLKEMGNKSIDPQDKLTIKPSLLPKDGETQIIILKP